MLTKSRPDLSELAGLTRALASCSSAREEMEDQDIENILEGLSAAAATDSDEDTERLLAYLRLTRNMVAGVERITNQVVQYFDNNFDVWEFIEELLDKIPSEKLPVLHVAIQLMSNLLSTSTSFSAQSADRLWPLATNILIRVEDAKSQNMAACLLLQALKQEGCGAGVPARLCDGEMLARLSERGRDTVHSDFALLCVRHVAVSEHFPQLTREERVLLLDLVRDLELVTSSRLPLDNLLVLVRDFTYLTDVILTTTLGSVDQLEPEKILLLLDILVVASQAEHYSTSLKGEKSLLLNTFYLLRMVHQAGRDGVTDFVPVGKLADVEKLLKEGEESLSSSPVLGFKVGLLRLLVNLTWDHEENKTLIGELDGVQLVLDCSQLDVRNPFITQWAVLAVKALVEEHPGNQAILAGLRREGVADSALLNELDLQLTEEGKIKSKPPAARNS